MLIINLLLKMKNYSVLLALLISSAAGGSETCWDETNCNPDGADGAVQGRVTDEVCGGHYSGCRQLDQASCSRSATCVWKSDKCMLNRDRKGNVCLPLKVKVNPVCNALTRGTCPLQWQVKRGCCPGHNAKYTGKLEASLGPDYVCCNTPCESLQETAGRHQNCSWTDHKHNQQCLPGAKMNGYMNSMVGTTTMDSLATAFGISASGGYFKTGTVLQGIPGPYQSINAMAATNSENMYVDELTVDDLLLLLSEALEQSDRHNVLTYEAQMTSDPWFGKNVHGGVQDNLRFMNPQKIIDTIYSPMNPAIASTFIKYPTYNVLGTMGLPPLPSMMNDQPSYGGGFSTDSFGLAMAEMGLNQFVGSGYVGNWMNDGGYGSGFGTGMDVGYGSYGTVGNNIGGQGFGYSIATGYGSPVQVATGLSGGYGQPVTVPAPTTGEYHGQEDGYGQGEIDVASSGYFGTSQPTYGTYAGYQAPVVNIGSAYSGYGSPMFLGKPVMATMPYLPAANQWQAQMTLPHHLAGGGLPIQHGYNKVQYGQDPVNVSPGIGQSVVGSGHDYPKEPPKQSDVSTKPEAQFDPQGAPQFGPQAGAQFMSPAEVEDSEYPLGAFIFDAEPGTGNPHDRTPTK